jgi:hypothetical protein
MNLTCKIVGFLFSVLVFCSATMTSSVAFAEEGKAPRGELLDGIIAVVGDHVVTRSELAQALAYPAALLKAKTAAGLPSDEVEKEFLNLQSETRDNLVNNQLILMSAKAEGMSVAEEVRRRMDKLREGFQGDQARLETFLKGQGFGSADEYETQMEEELLRQRLIFGRVRPRAELSDDDLAKAFAERYTGKEVDGAACAGAAIRHHELEQLHFAVATTVSVGEVMAAFEGAYRCVLALRSGSTTLLDSPTVCRAGGVAPEAGSLGEVDETMSFDPAFQQAFDALVNEPAGSYSDPFIIKDGIRILRVVSSRTGCVEDESQVRDLKDRVRARLEDEKFAKVLKWFLQELRGQFRVELKNL